MKTERIPITEEVLCAIALKSSNGRQTHHTQAGLPVCCEQALKGVGERNTHGGGPLRGPSGNPRARERSDTSGWREGALLDIEGGGLAAGVIPCWRIVDRECRECRSLCEWQPLKALRAPCGPIPIPQYKILHHCTGRDNKGSGGGGKEGILT
jgi:hypothetical protein